MTVVCRLYQPAGVVPRELEYSLAFRFRRVRGSIHVLHVCMHSWDSRHAYEAAQGICILIDMLRGM
jgi:hypothetical protein